MPRPALRTRSLRRIRTKLPGGAFVIHYFKRKPSGAVCAICKKPLHGVPRKLPSKLRRQPLPEMRKGKDQVRGKVSPAIVI
jgi:large subunit ribosomal protein L34e